jgi:hypothetical protein
MAVEIEFEKPVLNQGVIETLLHAGYKEMLYKGYRPSGTRCFEKVLGDYYAKDRSSCNRHFVAVREDGKWVHYVDGSCVGDGVEELQHILV